MKRAVLCVPNPQDYIDQLDSYSIMIVSPDSPPARKQYLLNHADYSLKITTDGYEERNGQDYGNERLFWYTSGTTGDSKFCSFTQAQVDALAQTIVDAYEISANDRYVGVMPLWHAHGQGFYWATKLAGCETHFISVKQIKTMPDHSPTFVTAVPDILKVIGQLTFDQNLRFVRSASAALPDRLYQDLQARFQRPIIEAFGMTEALSHCFTNPLHGEQRMGTVGFPSGVEAKIENDQLHIRGFSVFVDDWYNTGDLADQDAQGYYRILGRIKDRITIRGYKIDPISVERQLQQQLPDVGDCVIFGNQSVNCFYTGTATADQVSRCLINIHPACRPHLLTKQESIPISPSGKISRSWLTQTFNCK